MTQDKTAFSIANLLCESGMIRLDEDGTVKDEDFDYIFTLMTQVYAVGYDTGRHKHARSRAVVQYDMGGTKIAIHESAVIAARKIGKTKQSIQLVAIGERVSSGGFKWRYLDSLGPS